MSKVSAEMAHFYYVHRTRETQESYNAKHAKQQQSDRDAAAELEDARTDREGARDGRPHGNGLAHH